MRQHHAGAADPDALGDGRDGGDQDLGRRADDGGIAVVLGNPKAVIAQSLAFLSERDGVADRLAVGAVDDGDGLIEN
jgi:hypothetical protein